MLVSAKYSRNPGSHIGTHVMIFPTMQNFVLKIAGGLVLIGGGGALGWPLLALTYAKKKKRSQKFQKRP
jgi:hypothetical protein